MRPRCTGPIVAAPPIPMRDSARSPNGGMSEKKVRSIRNSAALTLYALHGAEECSEVSGRQGTVNI